jgi:hypothetical protein
VPVISEPFELALDPAAKRTVEPLLATPAESSVHARLVAMPGYDLSRSGELRLAA